MAQRRLGDALVSAVIVDNRKMPKNRVKYMEKPRNLFMVSSFLMAFLFAYSASVQLNDSDWYLWLPLYALASAVNLINSRKICNKSRRIRQITRTALSLGLFLLVKVITEDVITERVGILSLDLTHRVVREKIGSGLVIASMVLQLQASCSIPKEKSVDFGMAATVIFGYGLPFWFFSIQNGEIKI
ncbi:hypothetical protein F2Q69_00026850 [Brassica cretica]|uniref:Uncharacterized protein n=1 Tax=Brassica cretica TaxID=69181 RepID=A0A8S9S9D4_BRACR|nr:hypothetical protein F2Q69_00026850 [Brassica cretica]